LSRTEINIVFCIIIIFNFLNKSILNHGQKIKKNKRNNKIIFKYN
jgi:hypothetical protein